MAIANKEAKESKHFIRMLSKACLEYAKGGHELNLIFMSIIIKAKETEKKKNLEKKD